jgi:hypothetical protein
MVLRACLTSFVFVLSAVHPGVAAQEMPRDGSIASLVATEKAVAKLADSTVASDDRQQAANFSAALQALFTAQMFTGDLDGAIATSDRERRAAGRPVSRAAADDIDRISSAVAEDAIKAIVDEARQRRVVFLNEAHHVPMHRAFAMTLAAELRKIGYDYLACEAFAWGDGSVPFGPHGEIVEGTGYYIKDPVFAQFVSTAVADKWKLVSYEFDGETYDDRERGQAQNLVDRIFSRDKNARVFIYVGYGHENKFTARARSRSMAAYLGEMTGLDMLHVQQTSFFAHSDRADENEHYQDLLDRFPARGPFVLRSPDGSHPVLLGMQGIVDMQVIFPRYGHIGGRPEWLVTLLGREPRAIPPELLPAHGRRLVKAFARGGAPDAVPADVVMVHAGQPVPALMLPKGEYVYKTEQE